MRGRLDSFGVAMGIFLPNSIPGNSIDKWAATFPAAVALPNSGPRGGTAQLGRERFHLFAYFLERARTVDALRSIAQLLFHRHLRRDAPRLALPLKTRGGLRHAPAGPAPSDDEPEHPHPGRENRVRAASPRQRSSRWQSPPSSQVAA